MNTMSSDFEWRFGDDIPEDQGEEGQDSGRAWRRWLPWLLVLALAVGGGYAWWRDRQRNLRQAEAEVEQVARLELRALAEGDSELYLSLQDPADRSWKEAQAAYVETAGLSLPLHDLATPISSTVERARIVGERAQAVIVHRATLPSGEEAVFRAVRFYRYTYERRWLHTKVDPGYGGHEVVFVSDDLEIAVFDNDPIQMESLARKLANVPYAFCSLMPCKRYSLFGIDSAGDLEKARAMAATIGLDTTVGLSLAANLEEGAEPDDAVLPASFLVGAPANAAAQAAWEASLSEFLVDYLITEEIGPRPADEHGGALIEERLRAWFKAELEVTEPVSPNLDLARDALDNEGWIPLWRLWEIEPGDPEDPLATAEIDLLLAFIEEELGPSAIAELLHPLREASSTEDLLSHVPWAELLHSVREPSRSEQILNPVPWPARSSVELQFPAYVREWTAPSSDDLSAFASYELLIGCSEAAQGFRAAELWGWRLGSARPVLLSARPPDEALVPISWSPDGTQLLLRRGSRSPPGYFLVQTGDDALKRLVVPDGATLDYLGASGWSPDGSRLAYLVFTYQSPDSMDIESRIVDFGTGDEIALDGQFIAWSPDGSRLLYAQPSGSESASEAWLAEAAVRDFFVAQRDGSAPRWIGEGYAAALSPDGEQVATISTEQALLAYDLAAERWTTLLDRDTLRETLGFTRTFSAVSDQPFSLAWSPDGAWIAVGATQRDSKGAVESTIARARANEHRLLRRESGDIVNLAWAPNGRWLSVFLSQGEEFWTSVIGRDGSVHSREENTLISWSPNGRYMALTSFEGEESALEIVDVRSSEQREIDVPGRCWPPVWNPRGSGQEPSSEP
jgi:WD40 repeat protein